MSVILSGVCLCWYTCVVVWLCCSGRAVLVVIVCLWWCARNVLVVCAGAHGVRDVLVLGCGCGGAGMSVIVWLRWSGSSVLVVLGCLCSCTCDGVVVLALVLVTHHENACQKYEPEQACEGRVCGGLTNTKNRDQHGEAQANSLERHR